MSYFCAFDMQKILKTFFVFSLLTVFVYNVSGISVCFDHAGHAKSFAAKLKHSKTEKGASVSQDDECQCALHLQMHHVLLPDLFALELPAGSSVSGEMPHPKAIAYYCLLDYFSSRAPPHSSLAV
ncbi:hypothetical protein FY557_04860 [Chryseobacterium sp. SN22]|uniref:hypothetical protein n=1 Tax=Chryseobacterium sp. SN22 TaxID=2606431 RepID=UPI0011F077F2|nr:hypothetical protein [Chryseobacterium sp. SN22]KAA0129633.1 hypothetical protein FY557_04860 [Chryseobacterium sp. SN22]